MRLEFITGKYPCVLISHPFRPLETDLGVIISSFRVRIVPSRGSIRGLISSIGGG